jgi:transcription elongation GreA/GreB family factor
VDTSAITIGTKVTFDRGGQPFQLTILGPWDSDPNNHVVSYLAPAVAALIGRRVGDSVTYDAKNMVVKEIVVWG